MPEVTDVWLEQSGSAVLLNMELRALYGYYIEDVQPDETYQLRDIPSADRFRSPSIPPVRLEFSASDGNLVVSPSWALFSRSRNLPPLTFSLDVLSKRLWSRGRHIDLLAIDITGAAGRVANGNLAIGLDLDASQDPEARTIWPDAVPYVGTSPSNLAQFGASYSASFLDDPSREWGLALERSVFAAVVAVNSVIDIPPPGTPCDPDEGQIFVPYVSVLSIAPPSFTAHANGSFAHCGEQNGWQSFEAYLSGQIVRTRSRDFQLSYSVTSIDDHSPDLGLITDVLSDIFGSDRDSAVSPLPFPSAIDTGFGELSLLNTWLVEQGIALSGSASYGPTTRRLQYRILPETSWQQLSPGERPHVEFAAGCLGGPAERTIEVRDGGSQALGCCPLRFEGPEAANFSVVEPGSLTRAARGTRGTVSVVLRLETPPPGTADDDPSLWRNEATIVFPTNAGRLEFAASANLRPAEVTVPDVLSVAQVDHMLPCLVSPIPLPFDVTIALENVGRGTLQVCGLESYGSTLIYTDGRAPSEHNFPLANWFEITSALPLIVLAGESFELHLRCHLEHEMLVEHRVDMIANTRGDNFWLQVERTVSAEVADEFGIMGGIGHHLSDVLCAQIDWRHLPDPRRVLFEVPMIERFLDRFGGNPCCPPPSRPACLCADMLEISLGDLGERISLAAVDDTGKEFASASASASPAMLIPERAGVQTIEFAGQDMSDHASSRVRVRRFSMERAEHVETGEAYHAFAARGDLVFGSSASHMDIVRIAPGESSVVHSTKFGSGASAIAPIDDASVVLAMGDRLVIASEPQFDDAVELSGTYEALAYAVAKDDRMIWAAGGTQCSLVRVEVDGKPEVVTTVDFDSPVRDVYTWRQRTHVLTEQGVASIEVNLNGESRVHTSKRVATDRTAFRLFPLADRLGVVHEDGAIAFFRSDKERQLTYESTWVARDWSMYLPAGARSLGTVQGVGQPFTREGETGFSLYSLRQRKVEAAVEAQAD
jgi:hypothetical protein